MNKQLTPLEALERLRPKTTYSPYYTRNEKRYYCDIIETALKENVELKQMIRNFNEAIGEPQIIPPNVEKQLKALEIIKENLLVGYDENTNDKSCLTLGIKIDKDNVVIIYETFDKTKIDLLKEVLK